MSAEIIPFDFEEQAVRVVMRDGEPWFVAADVCRVLEHSNPSVAVSRLDDDERDTIDLNTLNTAEGIRGNPNATIISESGLYALVLTSRKPEARRFRKWVTAEVLPAIRRTGVYAHPGLAANDPDEAAADDFAGLPMQQAALWLQAVREARLTKGARAAVAIWNRSPLPPLDPAEGVASAAEGRAALAHLVQAMSKAGVAEAGRAGDFRWMSRNGLRALPEGLAVARFALPLYAGTRWAGGAHVPALKALPGVEAHRTTFAMRSSRALVLPWALVEEAA
ncbi:MAG: Bro-N domain-containing protein [Rhodosalinus sp.]